MVFLLFLYLFLFAITLSEVLSFCQHVYTVTCLNTKVLFNVAGGRGEPLLP